MVAMRPADGGLKVSRASSCIARKKSCVMAASPPPHAARGTKKGIGLCIRYIILKLLGLTVG